MGAAKVVEGTLAGTGLKVGIVASRFNELVVDRLIQGALDGLRRCAIEEGDVTVIRAPGAFEIPQVARAAVATGAFDAVICLGAVIRGGTPHFEYVCSSVTSGVAQLAKDAEIPVIFGVLTTDNVEQALDRAGVKAGNKGTDAAMAAVEMATLMAKVRQLAGGKRTK
jgi:6,7-dimethyl-8-ribityllumazine synthase